MNPDKFTLLPGGLKASVLHMNRQDLMHHAAMSDVLCNIIEHEAKAHHANFQAGQFSKIIDAVKDNKISAYFLLAGWDVCRTKMIGGSVEYATVLTEWDGNKFRHYPAIYGEDTCIMRNKLRELIQERPTGKVLPQNVGIGEYFERERIKRWVTNEYGDAPLGQRGRARIGEFSGHSSTMIKVLDDLGATRETEQEGAILEINGLTRAMKDKWHLPVDTSVIVTDKGDIYPNIFLTQWSGEGNKQQVVGSFTNGISTFTGDPVTRVQFTSNGNLPNNVVLQSALASILSAGQEEIEARGWGSAKEHRIQSPIIPVGGSRREIYDALLSSSQDEMLVRKIGAVQRPRIWNDETPVMRIHALKEPAISLALSAMDAQTRMLGSHSMLPVVMDFKNVPQRILGIDLNPARPTTIKPSNAANEPYYAFVA